MIRKVTVSSHAELAFEKIYLLTIEIFGKSVADKLFLKFNRFRDTVSTHPFAYGYYFRSKSIRKYILTKSILVLYKVKRTEIEIITVIYGSQDPKTVKKDIRTKK